MNWMFPYFTSHEIQWHALETHFHDIIESMKNCEQDQRYHGEGNVWNHTKLVMEEMLKLKDFQEASLFEQSLLMASAFFHDVSKPFDTIKEETTISSKKHASHGARLVRELFWNQHKQGHLKAPWHVREIITNMVMLHVLPALFLEKENPLYYVAGSSYVLKNKDLYLLALADVNGRKCQDPSNQINAIGMTNLFKDFCIENKCFEFNLPFVSEKARFRYFFDHVGHPDYELFENFKGTVVMMSGVQGSGKDYIINKSYKGFPVVGFDDTRKEMDVVFGESEGEVLQSVKEQCKQHMRIGKNFIFNATNTIKNVRSKWIRLFRQYGYKIIIHYVEKPMDVTLNNNKNRSAVIPEKVIHEKFANIDIPTLLECHELRMDVEE